MKATAIVVLFSIFSLAMAQTTKPPDDLLQAVSNAAAYRSQLEAIAGRIKAQHDASSPEYQQAQMLYNRARTLNTAFVESALRILGGTLPDRASADSAVSASLAADDFVKRVGIQQGVADKNIMLLIPPFVRVLLAIIHTAHMKTGKSVVINETLQKTLSWKTWADVGS